MPQATILLPIKLDLQNVLGFARNLDYYAMHDRLVVEFPNIEFFSPFGMLFIASKIKSLCTQNVNLKLEFKNHKDFVYPAHMGFFQMCGVKHGREVAKSAGGENFVPITRLGREQLYEAPSDKYQELPDLVQRNADRIALMIARDEKSHKDMYDALSFAIREVMRNVFEHSGADSLYYCAQYWPKSHRVEFAIADFGIGIRKGLSENPNFRFKTDKEAIEYSLLPSVSGKTHLPRTSPTWFNSGYGLYMTNRLARNGGNFVLASGVTAIHLSQKKKANFNTSFPGTVLRFNFDIEQIGNVTARLAEFRKDGFEMAKTIAGSANRPPSAMSLLLRRDFGARAR